MRIAHRAGNDMIEILTFCFFICRFGFFRTACNLKPFVFRLDAERCPLPRFSDSPKEGDLRIEIVELVPVCTVNPMHDSSAVIAQSVLLPMDYVSWDAGARRKVNRRNVTKVMDTVGENSLRVFTMPSAGLVSFKMRFDFFERFPLRFRQQECCGQEIDHGETGEEKENRRIAMLADKR